MASMLDACRANQGLPAKLTAGSRVGYDLSKVGAGASRGFSGKKKLEAAPWSGTWPAPGATLDLDFANNRGYVRGVGQGGVMDAITFTRASNGTFVGEDGLLKGGGNALGLNLLAFPQDFENAAWTKQNATIQANVSAAPNGTQTADLLLASAGSATHNVIAFDSTAISGQTATFSIYAQANTSRYFSLSCADGGNGFYAVFDLLAGVVTQSAALGGSLLAASIADAGGGWFRCVISGSGANRYALPALANAGTYTPDTFGRQVFNANGTESVFLWGAQLELGSTATEYFPTNINVPRFDWASTANVKRNLLSYTEQFNVSSAWAVFQATVTANSTTAPDGTTTADTIDFSVAGTGTISQNVSGVIAGNSYTLSVYLKGTVGGEKVRISFRNAFSIGIQGDQITLTTSWVRYSQTFTADVTDTRGFQLTTPNSEGDPVFYAWGAQLELGTVATAYQAIAQPTTNTPLVPAPTCNGLLIEEARTNRLLWCRDATQSSWVKTDITAAKDQTGIDGVANAASSLTATADGGTCIQTITLASGSRTGSVFLKRLTGTGIVQVSLDGTTWSTVDLSDTEWRRIVLSGTVTNPVVGIRLATSGDAVAMDFGQVEDNAGTLTTQLAATSPILTTSAATTRASDVAFISGAAFTSMNMDSPNKASMFAEFMPITLNNTSGNVAVISAENANQASIRLTCGTSNVFGLSYRIGATIFSVNVPFDSDSALLQKQKTFVSWSNQRLSASRNNQQTNFSEVNGTSANLIGWPMTSLGLSASQASSIQSKYISRLVYWPYTQSDTALQEFAR